MRTYTAEPRLWINVTNGIISCERHAGNYLTAAIEHAPSKRSHSTPLGKWVVATDEERAEWLRDMGVAMQCETCERATP